MNLFFIKKWIQHRLTAKNRHGIHSPFVFQFIEVVLRHSYPSFTDRLKDYFAGSALHFISAQQLEERFNNLVADDTIVIVSGIYGCKEGYRIWRQYAAKSNVPLSMEAAHCGFLCFKKDFIVKQHFVVR